MKYGERKMLGVHLVVQGKLLNIENCAELYDQVRKGVNRHKVSIIFLISKTKLELKILKLLLLTNNLI